MIDQAAKNNARWCDAVCRANGAPGEFHTAIWLNRHRVPPFYPNAVTLTPGGAAGQLARIAEVCAARRAFAVKDSFAALDLRPLGLDVLFEATWIHRPAGLAAPDMPDNWTWSVISGAGALARWEAAWAGTPNGSIADSERIFRPALLETPGVAFLAGLRGGRIAAVAAVNRTGEVAGLSNVFAPDEAPATVWAGAVALAVRLFPGRPLVGYERDDDLVAARAAGFEPLGPLRVWARDE